MAHIANLQNKRQCLLCTTHRPPLLPTGMANHNTEHPREHRGVGRGGGGGGGNNQGQQKDDKHNKRGPGGGGRCREWVDQCHPKIVGMMAEYVAARGMRIQLTVILDAANKCITDLPTIPDYIVNGCLTVCWVYTLGRCTFHNCAFKQGHIPWDKIPNKFAEEVAAMLAPGVAQVIQCEVGSPGKRPKIEPWTAP